MLMKMIRLDYMNVRRELPASVVMMAGAVIVSLGGDAKGTAVLAQGILVLLAAILILMGLNRLVGSAMFGTEGAFRLLLPVDARGEDSFESPHRRTVAGFAAQCGPAADSGRLCRLRWFSRCENAFYGTDGPVSPLHRFFASDSGNLHGFGAASAGFDRQRFCMGIMISADRDQPMVLKRFKGLGIWIITLFGRSHLWGLFAGLGPFAGEIGAAAFGRTVCCLRACLYGLSRTFYTGMRPHDGSKDQFVLGGSGMEKKGGTWTGLLAAALILIGVSRFLQAFTRRQNGRNRFARRFSA